MTYTRRIVAIASVLGLIVIGHQVAVVAGSNKATAWIYVAAFYAGWIITSLCALLNASDIRRLFQRGSNPHWNVLPLIWVIPITIFIFIPNLQLLRLDGWLFLNAVICLVNPFLEEIYWRGLAGRISDSSIVSFLFSTLGFAASHP